MQHSLSVHGPAAPRRGWVKVLCAAFTLAALALSVPDARAASLWTPIPSGTTDEISAVEYQSPSRFWYATTNGRLAFRDANGVFQAGTGPPPGVIFNDIAFQPGGSIGIAVGNANNLWRTTDAGHTWTKVFLPPTINNDDCFGAPAAGTSTVNDLYAISWASNGIVYVTGDRGNVLRSVDAGVTFAEVNKLTTSGCRLGGSTRITDVYFLPSDPQHGWFVSTFNDPVFETTDGLASVALARGIGGLGQGLLPRITVDPANPSRSWVVDRCGFVCATFSENGGGRYDEIAFPGQTVRHFQETHDVAFSGGTVLMAGSAGQIANSIDGRNFFMQPADGPLLTKDWRTVDLFDAAHGAVGGIGGALAVSDRLNTIPPPPPVAPAPVPAPRPVPVPRPIPAPRDTTAPRLQVSRPVLLNGGRVRVTFTCPATEQRCIATGTLRATVRRNRRTRSGGVLAFRFSAAGGARRSVTMTLLSPARRALVAKRPVGLTVAWRASDLARNQRSDRATFALKRATRRR